MNKLGVTLYTVDLATNKVLALVGRIEPRDWIGLIQPHRSPGSSCVDAAVARSGSEVRPTR